ncbi:hypothetical protein WMY93_031166 [Mugilogobius chulae]|uniref:Uncharacterized protein n=1 Tax=Mugilogobius chulae TaxID=88201 RepID=A0AAW0MN81_9GOBI
MTYTRERDYVRERTFKCEAMTHASLFSKWLQHARPLDTVQKERCVVFPKSLVQFSGTLRLPPSKIQVQRRGAWCFQIIGPKERSKGEVRGVSKSLVQFSGTLRLQPSKIQICAEFHRISNVNLRNQFYAELDRHIPELFSLFRKKASNSGKAAETLRNMIEVYDKQQVQDANVKRTMILHGLPYYLREGDKEFFKFWNKGQSPEPDLNNTPIGIVTVVNEDPEAAISFGPVSAAIVIEDEILLSDISSWPEAFVLLFGLVYALHLDYPKKLLHTFTFAQKFLLGLEDGKPLKSCLINLQNDLSLVL